MNDESIRIYVPLLMRPWVMQACHSTASCHLGTARTLRMLERSYWWIGMSICTRWWIRNCLKCRARKTPRQTVRWPTITLPLSEGPGLAVNVDSYHPNGNGGVERVNYTTVQMLAMVINELLNSWDEQLPHVELAYNNSVSAATGLAPNGVHMGRLPRLPLTIFERAGVAGHHNLARDHPAYCDLATDRQQGAFDIVREHHGLTVARVNRRSSTLSDALRPVPKFAVGGWELVYNTAATIRQGVGPDTGAKVLKAKLPLNWTDPYKVLAVDPCSSADTPDGSPLGAKLLYFNLPSDMPGADARRRVSGQSCKPCANPHDRGDMQKYLPAGLTQYVLNNFFKKFPPYHVTQDDVSPPLQTTRSGKDYWAPIGSRSGWRRRGDVRKPSGQDYLDYPGNGKWTSSFLATKCCATGPAPQPAPPNQPPVPPDDN